MRPACLNNARSPRRSCGRPGKACSWLTSSRRSRPELAGPFVCPACTLPANVHVAALAPPCGWANNMRMIDLTRYPHLAQIQAPSDLRRVPDDELPAVADELRQYLIEAVASSGGHFGAGLGVVELTVALHHVFDTPDRKSVV